MTELLSENLLFIAIALVIGLVVAWWIFAASRKTTIQRENSDEAGSVVGAKRNQALIDSTPAAARTQEVSSDNPELSPPIPVQQAPVSGHDDLKRIKGIGPKVEKLLHELGVTSFAQIAAWDDADVARIDAQLGSFAGRIERDDWRLQATLLADGDTAAYESKFGKL